ncbi:hypothetical protein Pelo_13292 [Pelomyxa schiedti]|nr:hypothetical protein Pelo_13292 [Pelomyxa schiedti]
MSRNATPGGYGFGSGDTKWPVAPWKFFEAARDGRVDVLSSMLRGGTHVDSITEGEPTKMTALHWASRFGQVSSVKVLLSAGASVNLATVV